MTTAIEEAQKRLLEKQRLNGSDGDLAPRAPMGGREWAEKRMADWVARGAVPRGRRVKCVACGAEFRFETNRKRRLKTIPCQECEGRLRPLNWFRASRVKRMAAE